MNPTPEKTSVMPPFILMLFLYFIVGLFTVINQQFQVPLKSALLPHDGNMTNALVTFWLILFRKDSLPAGSTAWVTGRHRFIRY